MLCKFTRVFVFFSLLVSLYIFKKKTLHFSLKLFKLKMQWAELISLADWLNNESFCLDL